MINAGIVGLGCWGRVPVQSGPNATESPSFTLGSTRTGSKAQEFADEQGFALVDSYEELLANDDPDASHGIAVLEAIVKSAESVTPQKVG